MRKLWLDPKKTMKVDIPPTEPTPAESQVEEGDLILLARLIQAEAEGEPYLGKIAVGAVVVNRLRHPDFPDRLLDVIWQKGQFESVENGWFDTIWEPNVECREAALLALQGVDPTEGALFFFNPAKTPNRWLRGKQVTLSIGEHLFVR